MNMRALVLLCLWAAVPLEAQDPSAGGVSNASVTVGFVQTDLRAVIQALGRYLPKPVLVGNVQPLPVSFETPAPVPRSALAGYLKGIVESQGLQLTEDSTFYRAGPKSPDQALRQSAGPSGRPDTGTIHLFVIRLKHARAADVAATVNQLFGGGGEFSGRSGLSGGTLSDELRRNVVPPTGAAPAAGQSTTGAPVRPAALSGAVTVRPDELTNSLLIRASKEDFDVLGEAVNQLDIRPLQVLIEVLIVEARRDRGLSLASPLLVPPQGTDKRHGSVGVTQNGGSLGDLVIQLMTLGHAQIRATLSAAASRGAVEIVSRPVLLASNNTETRLLVGSQRPFVQVSRSLPTETPTRDQVVQYKDVGTRLTVRPTLNQDGYVSLLIQQEVNQATAETQFDAPVISTREAATQVLVKDGQTIVLGGLRDHERDINHGGVPILSDIPLIGGLFGSSDRHTTETELYLFLTPRIIKTDADADSVTTPRLPKGDHQ